MRVRHAVNAGSQAGLDLEQVRAQRPRAPKQVPRQRIGELVVRGYASMELNGMIASCSKEVRYSKRATPHPRLERAVPRRGTKDNMRRAAQACYHHLAQSRAAALLASWPACARPQLPALMPSSAGACAVASGGRPRSPLPGGLDALALVWCAGHGAGLAGLAPCRACTLPPSKSHRPLSGPCLRRILCRCGC